MTFPASQVDEALGGPCVLLAIPELPGFRIELEALKDLVAIVAFEVTARESAAIAKQEHIGVVVQLLGSLVAKLNKFQ